MRRTTVTLAAAALLAGTAIAAPGGTAIAGASGLRAPGSHTVGAGAPAALIRGHRAGIRHITRAEAARLHATTAPAPASRLSPMMARLPARSDGTVVVSVLGTTATLGSALRRLGGRLLVSSGDQHSVVLPRSRLAELAGAPGVGAVRAPVRAYPDAQAPLVSEGVSASGATGWQAAGIAGAGVDVGIVDVGFTGLAAQERAHALPGDTEVTNENCTAGGQPSVDTEAHGTAVAEIVHQMAPGAHLHLYCIADTVGFAAAATAIEADPAIRIVSSSLSFPGDSRGDGTGGSSGSTLTADGVVRAARQHGVLWIESAGNSADDHWHGALTDADADGLADINGVYDQAGNRFEDDLMFVAPGSSSAPSDAEIDLQWDQWPTTTADVTLAAYGFQCTAAFTASGCGEHAIDPDSSGNPTPIIVDHAAGSAPTAAIPLQNTTGFDQYWDVVIGLGTPYPTTRYDLTYVGALDGPSYLACQSVDANDQCVISPGSYQGSIAAPANSPYALAVGAATAGADGRPAGTPESFSSQGPTIDGRTKPELAGWDGVSSPVYGAVSAGGGFYGTSAAAPHVAGAAALVLAAAPGLDAAQLQDVLQRRAGSGAPVTPPSNVLGHGLLTLGAPSGVTAPTAARFQAITPTRILDTRTALGGHHAALAAGGTLTVTVPGLPDDATAVAVNLTGVGASAGSYLSAYAAGTAFPGTSNLNLSPTDPTAAVLAIVTVRNKAITIRNSTGSTNVLLDELGYFGTGSEAGGYTPLAPARRVLDTRTATGNYHRLLAPGAGVLVRPALPTGASAAVVTVTTTDTKSLGFVSAGPACSNRSSTVNFTRYPRANLAVVGLDGNGSFCVLDGGSAADVIVDVVGYVGPGGAGYVALPSAQRIVDTRTGNGGSAGQQASRPFAAGTATAFYGTNVGVVPSSTTALFTGVVEAGATASGYLSTFAGTARPPSPTSVLNFGPGRVVADASIIGVSGDDFGVFNSAGSTDAAVDLFGYFVPLPA